MKKDTLIKTALIAFVLAAIIGEGFLSFHAWSLASKTNDVAAYVFAALFALLIPYSIAVTVSGMKKAALCDRQIELLDQQRALLETSATKF